MAAAKSRAPRAGRNVAAALMVGLPLFGLVIVGLIFWPPSVVILTALLAALGATELRDALRRVGSNVSVVPVTAGVAAMVLVAYAAALWPGGTWWAVEFGVAAAVVAAVLIWRMPRGAQGYTRDVAGGLFIVGYVGVLASFIGPLMAPADGPARVAIMFMCVCASDTGGYILGATLGRHPMAPQISPKKSWEGLAGSVVLACVVGVLMAIYALGRPWWFGLVVGLVTVAFGTLGDLIESMIKRDVGIKDMSSILPGHGGIMDRLDSMLLSMPAVWLVFLLPL